MAGMTWEEFEARDELARLIAGPLDARDELDVLPLFVAVAGAVLVVLQGFRLVSGGWLGLDISLTAAGFWLGGGGTRARRAPILRPLLGVTLLALLLTWAAVVIGTAEGGSLVRGDARAAALLYADVRAAAGHGPALAAWGDHPTLGLWASSLGAHLAIGGLLVGLLARRAPRRVLAATAVTGLALVIGIWATARSWPSHAVLCEPAFRLIGLALGYVAGSFAARPGRLVQIWAPAAVVATAFELVLVRPTPGFAAGAVAIAVFGTASALSVWHLSGAPKRRTVRTLVVAGATMIVAGPALATVGPTGGTTARIGGGLLVVLLSVLAARVMVGWDQRIPRGRVARMRDRRRPTADV